ncbi:DNA-binding domain-containing protein [Pseudoalteromonas sp. SS15]|uniref:HvfC family RiPP maturation protein n=1 Tax=Pseudoalteromonas sp. SS15 TaxID=3139393 RepID=UPI003BAABA89
MSFIDVQNAFMAHIRDPENVKKPHDVTEERMTVYKELFFNNVEGFVSSAFPVLKSLYCESHWQTLVRTFFISHDCSSPYFLDISAEFLAFLQHEYVMQESDPIFMLELAHYEWVELDVSVCFEDEMQKQLINLDNQPLYLSNTARNLSYQYPVHQISEDFQPTEPSEQPHYFVVYRDEEDDVGFIASNPMTAILLEQLDNNPGINLLELVSKVVEIIPQFSEEQLIGGATQTLNALAELGVVVTK